MDYTWQGVYTDSLIALMAMLVALYRAHQTNIPGRCGVAGDEKADEAAQLLEAASMLLRNLSILGTNRSALSARMDWGVLHQPPPDTTEDRHSNRKSRTLEVLRPRLTIGHTCCMQSFWQSAAEMQPMWRVPFGQA